MPQGAHSSYINSTVSSLFHPGAPSDSQAGTFKDLFLSSIKPGLWAWANESIVMVSKFG